MPNVSLTDFVDVVSKAGTSKINKVRSLKHRPAYNPKNDFYKIFRDQLLKIHKNGDPRRELSNILDLLTDKKKIKNYPSLIDGYKRWWGRKTLVWFDPPSETWSANAVDIRVNPELGLEYGGNRYIIKMYLKAEPLTKARVDIITHLMDTALRDRTDQDEIMAVLDVRKSHLITPTVPIPTLRAGLLGVSGGSQNAPLKGS